MYPRHVLPILLEALQDTPVVLFNGARQTGKSTLAQQFLAGQSHRLTFDDPVVLAAVKHDTVSFIDDCRYTYVTGRSLSLWAITHRVTPTSTTHCQFLSRLAVPLFQKPQKQALNENKIGKSKTERKPWGF